MFRLWKKICCNKFRICSSIGYDQDLAWSGRHIYCDPILLDKLLRFGYKLVTGTKYFIDFRDAFRTKGHCSYCLRTSNFINISDTNKLGGIEDQRIYFPVAPGRGTNYYLFATGNSCRYTQHEDCRKKRCAATRYIKSGFFDSDIFSPAENTFGSFNYRFSHKLCGMELLNI